MERGPGSFIKNKDGKLEENLKDPVMKKRKEIREKKAREKKAREKKAREKESPGERSPGERRENV